MFNLYITLLLCWCLESIQPYSGIQSSQYRFKRQEDTGVEDDVKGQVCDFGSGSLLQSCNWFVPNGSHPTIRWKTAQGAQEFWLGGPGRDHTLSDTSGGYAYFETSFQSNNQRFQNQPTTPVRSSSSTAANQSLIRTTSGHHQLSSNDILRPLISRFPIFQLTKDNNKQITIPDYSLFQSPNITDTGSQGLCLGFYYSIDGLSADSLQVVLIDSKTGYNRTLSMYNDVTDGIWIKSEIAYTYAGLHRIAMKANAKSITNVDRSFRGYIAIDDVQFKQMDETAEEACKGFCTFEAGFCQWTNQDENDDFDWKLGRGSQNIFTGPARDYSSFDNNEISGGYVYIDANYPRRPGDLALLLSPTLNPTSDSIPLCLKFALHMFGNGVGTLRVKMRYSGGDEPIPDQLLWEMSGESGNNWHIAQLPISSPVLSFQVIFEGEIGLNSLGVIAIDNIAFEEGNCPVLPQTASKGSGDCTFDENMCSWSNPNSYSKVDDFDWLRQFSLGNFEPKTDHTKRSSEGYFINLSGDNTQPQRGGTRAWIYSPEFIPQSTVPKCMTFYYYMFERTIDSAGPSLGSLRVYVKTVTDNGESMSLIWRLNNHQAQAWKMAKVPITIGPEMKTPLQNYQIIIEGIWGDGRVGTIAVDDISFFNGNCTTYPPMAMAVFGECSFDRDLCGYRNQSGTGPGPVQASPSLSKAALERKNPNRLTVLKDMVTWKLATPNSRPANLQDHSFRAPIGYIYFDVFNQNSVQYPILRSPEFQPKDDRQPRCVSFWFTPFGRGDSTVLSVYVITLENQETNSLSEDDEKKSGGGVGGSGQPMGLESKALVWRITTRKFDSSKPEWMYAQVAVSPETSYRVQFEGEASDGGFALDDITYYDGTCQTRPLQAAVGPPPESNEKSLRE
ncbi:hypothetical protein RDWZM_003930 [Blomia tropicalis]|uniref:MAM domain-containing protein n=1 Tax=Blomia tropicalis TaxID=40697 RepID=A0A9Q0RT57_BLOTA|nr:hypothetical protein RDWZM_003930 [Blomia tropicalis]